MSDDQDLRETIHSLNNMFARILTTAELIEQDAEQNHRTVADAQSIQEAALAGRDLVAKLHRRLCE